MTINNKEYTTPTLNFGAMCKLEQWGLSIGDLSSRPLGFLSGFISLAVGGDDLAAGQAAIDAHLENGGSLDDLTDALNKAVEASGFFKQMEEEKTPA